MTTRDIFFKSSLSQLKIDQHSSLKSFKDTITMDLVQEISRVFLLPLKSNKQEEEISESYDDGIKTTKLTAYYRIYHKFIK